MAAFRAVLVAIVALAMILSPLIIHGSPPPSTGAPSVAYSAPLSGEDNDDDNEDNEDNDDNEDENDNDDDGGDEDDNDNDDDGDAPPPPPPPPPPAAPADAGPPPTTVSECYGPGQTGPISLFLPGGSVTATVVPASPFPSTTRLTLERVDPVSAPGTPGPRLDDILFNVRAQDGCDGGEISQLPAGVNLGVSYSVGADKSRLRFAIFENGQWVNVPTVADPNPGNPFISATINRAGGYTVYQAP
jgi:hypothetical protein